MANKIDLILKHLKERQSGGENCLAIGELVLSSPNMDLREQSILAKTILQDRTISRYLKNFKEEKIKAKMLGVN